MATHPLQATGQISFADINLELNRSSTAQIGLDTAENGGYGAINRCSSPNPNSSNPAAISEWYGYNHNAASTDLGTMDTDTISCASICGQNVAGTLTLYLNTAGNFAYLNASCNTAAGAGYYADMTRTYCYTVGSGGAYLGQSTCITTTTTTTTTLATGDCYTVYNPGGAVTVYWTSIDGVSRSDTIYTGVSQNVCSLITPYELNASDLQVTPLNYTCNINCTSLACTSC